MRKVILDLAVTLDGYIEGPNGEIDWCVLDPDMDFDGFLATIDTILYGRVSYDRWGQYQPEATAPEAEKALWASVHTKEKIVFSRQAPQNTSSSYIANDIPGKVAELKMQQGKDIWLYGGAQLITTFVQHGLIDVYRVSVHPTVLGSGTPLFQNLSERINLTLQDVKTFQSGVVQLVYEHIREGI